jgi:hypothetical protein
MPSAARTTFLEGAATAGTAAAVHEAAEIPVLDNTRTSGGLVVGWAGNLDISLSVSAKPVVLRYNGEKVLMKVLPTKLTTDLTLYYEQPDCMGTLEVHGNVSFAIPVCATESQRHHPGGQADDRGPSRPRR